MGEEFLKTIEDRLSTLEEEKEELKEYQKYDKMRRALEYTIHDRELQDTLQDAQDSAKAANKEVKDMKLKENAIKEERDSLNAEAQQQTKEKTRLEFIIKDLKDNVTDDNNSKDRAEHELNKLKETIQT